MSKIRFHGHNSAYATKRPENDLYKSTLEAFRVSDVFEYVKSLKPEYSYENIEEQFAYEWRFHIRKELEKHIDMLEFDMCKLTPYNLVKIYNTDILQGRIFVKSIIVPKIKTNEKIDGRLKKNERFDYQINLEVGVYTDDGYNACVFENLYMTAN